MKRLFTIVLAALMTCLASAQMTDQAVVSYIKQGVENGKSQNQIAKDLLAKGVSTEQLQKILKMYQSGGLNQMTASGSATSHNDKNEPRSEVSTASSTRLRDIGTKTEPQDSLPFMNEKRPLGESEPFPKTESEPFQKTKTERVDNALLWKGKKIPVYGHDIFGSGRLTFEPNVNMPTPSDYVLGPGDEVIIDVWGVNEITLHEAVSPDGKIYIEQIGPVDVAGLTVKQASGKLKSVLSQKYSLSGPEAESKMSVTLGNIRTINVNVIGEVKTPGTYRLSSLSSVMNALYSAGGVTPIGSMRAVQIARGGKIMAVVDLYDFIFEGSSAASVPLRDGDAIIVPAYSAMVEMGEGFKRPMLYEAIPGESVEAIVHYAGGFTSNASDSEVSVSRLDGNEGKMFTVKKSDFNTFKLCDGDVLTGYINETDVYENRIEIKGSVLRPGVYALGGEIATLRQLVEHAGGLLEDAFTARAQLIREKADRSLEVSAIALNEVLNGREADVLLRKNDILIISNANEINPKGDISISGYVANPGDYEYAEGMSIEDIIMLAGGLKDGASSIRVDIARRLYDDKSTEASDTISNIFTCDIEDGMMVSGTPEFTLQPYDVVSVRKSPTYVEQKLVLVSGEMTFPGEYTLIKNNERLSELYNRAGGATSNGYINGATVRRKLSEDERILRMNLLAAGKNRIDTTDIHKLMKMESYLIGINLEKALSEPGGEYDILLRDGDELIVPEITNTVSVQGDVFYPNSISYVEGKSIKYYVKQAGGFTTDAKRSQVFVVYMNGQVSSGMNSEVIPGCEIYVPSRPEHKKMSVGEWMSIGTTAASLTTMIATITNLIK